MQIIDVIIGIVIMVLSFFMMMFRSKKLNKLIYQYEVIYLLVLFLLFMLGVIFILDGVTVS